VPGARGVAVGVLRLAATGAVSARAARRAPAGPRRGIVRTESTDLRQPAGPRRSRRRARGPQSGHAAHAGPGPGRARAPTVSLDDDERPRPTGRGQCAQSRLHRHRGEPALGGRHHRTADHYRQVLPRRDRRPVRAARRRLGGERGQRSAPHDRPSTRRCACAVPTPACSTTPTRAARTRARTTRRCSATTASRAA